MADRPRGRYMRLSSDRCRYTVETWTTDRKTSDGRRNISSFNTSDAASTVCAAYEAIADLRPGQVLQITALSQRDPRRALSLNQRHRTHNLQCGETLYHFDGPAIVHCHAADAEAVAIRTSDDDGTDYWIWMIAMVSAQTIHDLTTEEIALPVREVFTSRAQGPLLRGMGLGWSGMPMTVTGPFPADQIETFLPRAGAALYASWGR